MLENRASELERGLEVGKLDVDPDPLNLVVGSELAAATGDLAEAFPLECLQQRILVSLTSSDRLNRFPDLGEHEEGRSVWHEGVRSCELPGGV